ncbi:hypothetical protein EF096_10710 [Pseudomonas neustonica]|uniref:Uncharacterized protein n=1 Tax=Pseudomonas neustonica TaxID=2487346 RepID=A0ABX9XHR2_9PSED|nr:hypothetical protein EF099_07805 [Pseudomonas sp. SSM44]ROZ84457.1 hypothetical protein EF096_10710 [Pseudomonas neustonica]
MIEAFDCKRIPLVQITGNGPGEKSIGSTPTLDVTFNLAKLTEPKGNQVFIRNARVAEQPNNGPLVVSAHCFSSSALLQLQHMLRGISEELAQRLGCPPSAGLTAILCFSEIAHAVRVDRAPLVPSLARPSEMGRRKPLACVFHNWLGERRLAMKIGRHSPDLITWPSFHYPGPDGGTEQANPLQRLLNIFNEQQPCESLRRELQLLAGASNNSWLASLTPATLEDLEVSFFLPRNTQHTKQWWLYDNEASTAVDLILKRLIWSQQYLASL